TLSLSSLLPSLFSYTLRRPPPSPLFPYTTLFRSLLDLLMASSRGGGQREILVALVEAARACYPRPVLFIVRGDTLVHWDAGGVRSEEHTSELQSLTNLVGRLLLEKKN